MAKRVTVWLQFAARPSFAKFTERNDSRRGSRSGGRRPGERSRHPAEPLTGAPKAQASYRSEGDVLGGAERDRNVPLALRAGHRRATLSGGASPPEPPRRSEPAKRAKERLTRTSGRSRAQPTPADLTGAYAPGSILTSASRTEAKRCFVRKSKSYLRTELTHSPWLLKACG